MAKPDTLTSSAADKLDAEVARPDGRGLDGHTSPALPKTAPHDDGSQANETMDGLDPETEAVRHAAEDTPTGTKRNKDDVPVFDRAGLPPKV